MASSAGPKGKDLEPIAAQLFALGPFPSWRGFDHEVRVAGAAGRIWRERPATGDGEPAGPWTVHFRLPVQGPLPTLTMDLRPDSDAERRAVARGLAVDVQLDDPPFDSAFVVEAAPADAIRVLLDEPTRDALVALAPIRLKLDGGALLVSKVLQGVPDDYERAVEIVAPMVHASAMVGERIPSLAREMARTSMAASYRGPTPTAEHDERERAASQVAAIETVRVKRERRTEAQRIGIGLGVLVAVLAGIVWSLSGR